MCDQDEKFLSKAIEAACDSVRKGNKPFGAIVTKDGKIVAVGENEEFEPELDPTNHAEVVAIRKACRALNTFYLTGCTLYASCYPCTMCMGASLFARLDRLVYASTTADADKFGFDDKKYYEFMVNKRDGIKIEQIKIEKNAEKPFLQWKEKQSKND